MPLPNAFARFNRRVANPVIRHISGKAGPLALVEHRGRRSGRRYSTPVMAFPHRQGWVIPLTYGTQRDWVRNVCAASEAGLVIRRKRVQVTEPRIATGAEERMPLPARVVARLARAPHVLLIRTVTDADAPGAS
ncbi:MAG: nitroreductase family deazaflavin-dependent oxidoreductase [Acidimicrobiia bacterium]